MYNYISGKLTSKTPAYAVIETGGIGYEIRITLNTYSSIKENSDCKLFTHLYVKEDVQMLYGFQNEDEKHAFLQLIGVSGIGPSTALMVLSSLSVSELVDAVSTENVSLIQSVKGIGAKTAKRLILELKDKLGQEIASASQVSPSAANIESGQIAQKKEEALQALIILGLGKPAAEKGLQAIIKKYGNTLSIEEMIKYTLKNN